VGPLEGTHDEEAHKSYAGLTLPVSLSIAVARTTISVDQMS
jgi:hypothetical protein